jgi:hypothetical protein
MRDSAVIHFRRNMVDLARRKPTSALMMFSTLQSSPWGRQNFLAKPLVTHQWMAGAFIASNGGCRTLRPAETA